MLSFLPKEPHHIIEELRIKFRERRRTLRYTQKELSTRSGVSLGSLKRFEYSGDISIESLLKLAFILECLGDFEGVCVPQKKVYGSLEEVLR